MKTIKRVVDNRTFILGLDELYREAMKSYEREELLNHARKLAGVLDIKPMDCPVEGYYYEEPELTEYFKLMRALQEVSCSERKKVSESNSFLRLYEITTSALFGNDFDPKKLLPSASNPFNQALEQTYPNWTIPEIVSKAYDMVIDSNDYSLVSLGVLTQDPVVITALRESVALYMVAVAAGPPEIVEYEYIWDVETELEKRAESFIKAFNRLFNNELPFPEPINSEKYFLASNFNSLFGRCIYIGNNNNIADMKYYHWKLDCTDEGNFKATDFWDKSIVTTEMNRAKMERY